jgi:phosphoribosylformylglycinamidine synthase
MDFTARIFVTPKAAVLDPQGKAIASSLNALGYTEVRDVRLGKCIDIHLSGPDADSVSDKIAEMCHRLLANEIIEEFSFVVENSAR